MLDDEIACEQLIIDLRSLVAFYRFVNQRIANRPMVGPIIDENAILTDSRDKASRYFSSFVWLTMMLYPTTEILCQLNTVV